MAAERSDSIVTDGDNNNRQSSERETFSFFELKVANARLHKILRLFEQRKKTYMNNGYDALTIDSTTMTTGNQKVNTTSNITSSSSVSQIALPVGSDISSVKSDSGEILAKRRCLSTSPLSLQVTKTVDIVYFMINDREDLAHIDGHQLHQIRPTSFHSTSLLEAVQHIDLLIKLYVNDLFLLILTIYSILNNL